MTFYKATKPTGYLYHFPIVGFHFCSHQAFQWDNALGCRPFDWSFFLSFSLLPKVQSNYMLWWCLAGMWSLRAVNKTPGQKNAFHHAQHPWLAWPASVHGSMWGIIIVHDIVRLMQIAVIKLELVARTSWEIDSSLQKFYCWSLSLTRLESDTCYKKLSLSHMTACQDTTRKQPLAKPSLVIQVTPHLHPRYSADPLNSYSDLSSS